MGGDPSYVELSVQARIVGVAPDYDLAVLQLDPTRAVFRPITIGTSADLQVGQSAFAIGNPFGLEQTLTSGIVSALHRRLPSEQQREVGDLIQIDHPSIRVIPAARCSIPPVA
ncbi:MAG TPA: trypsin-like peptidase domain-containing protein [Steroidobacteraceae bacterium]|nr:trypsin-like peptidase domain-containing protein [Steroidobacteraceae bacterium]